MFDPALIRHIRAGYSLPWRGTHGVTHWARVLENGLRLADRTGAHRGVVALFAIFHDSRRVNEEIDHGHGRRGSDLAAELRGRAFDLPDEEFGLLRLACDRHTDGLTEADVTVQTCWDADRLDLGRVGIRPQLRRLCTEAARDPVLLRWAVARSGERHEPEFVATVWERI